MPTAIAAVINKAPVPSVPATPAPAGRLLIRAFMLATSASLRLSTLAAASVGSTPSAISSARTSWRRKNARNRSRPSAPSAAFGSICRAVSVVTMPARATPTANICQTSAALRIEHMIRRTECVYISVTSLKLTWVLLSLQIRLTSPISLSNSGNDSSQNLRRRETKDPGDLPPRLRPSTGRVSGLIGLLLGE
jgi:hypothetical protein